MFSSLLCCPPKHTICCKDLWRLSCRVIGRRHGAEMLFIFLGLNPHSHTSSSYFLIRGMRPSEECVLCIILDTKNLLCFSISHSFLSYLLYSGSRQTWDYSPDGCLLWGSFFLRQGPARKGLYSDIGVYSCHNTYVYAEEFPGVTGAVSLCQTLHVGCDCWWGKSLDKRPFNTALWRLHWNVHRTTHSFAVPCLFCVCVCGFKMVSFSDTPPKSLLHP